MSALKVIGLVLINPQTAWEFNWNSDRRFPLGSVAKLLIASATLGMQKGELDVSQSRLAQDAISLHNSTATDGLLHIAGGPEAVNRWLDAKGYSGADIAANQRDTTSNSATPKTMARLLDDLLSGRLLQGSAREVVLGALAAQADEDGVLQGLPSGARWAHMTGGFDGVCNDVGILTKPGSTLICCVFIQGDPAGDWHELRETVARIGRIVWALP